MSVCSSLVRGSLNVDEYFYVDSIVLPGETISSHRHAYRVGGKGANQAVAIVRAGGRPRFYGSIGKDAMWVRDKMREYGVDVEGIAISDELHTGRAIIQVDAKGENAIVLFPGANWDRGRKDPLPSATHLLLQNEIDPRDTVDAVLAHDGVVIFNPSPLPKDILNFPWDRVSWLIVNYSEARGLYEALIIADEREKTESIEASQLVLKLSQTLKEVSIVCTLGAEGVVAREKGQEGKIVRVQAPELGPVVDSTGAGDCFAGYFVQGLVDGLDLEQNLRRAATAATMSVQREGTIDSIPLLTNVLRKLSV